MTSRYEPRRSARSRLLPIRGLRCHLLEWGAASADAPPLLMLHGWMDVAASFQFVVDALARERHVFALDWRGFGRSDASGADAYWFPDYLGDLDAVLDAVAGERALDLLGHSMGANVAMIYAGVRPQRVRRLVNLEGFGMPSTQPEQAPQRYAQWLDELKQPQRLRDYANLDEVAQRLQHNNPRLSVDKAAWLAERWSGDSAGGRRCLLADPAHKRVNPVLYRKEETLACWRRIAAPVLFVEGDATEMHRIWGERYTRADFEQRLAVVPKLERMRLADCGHMLHHDQPQALAALLDRFLL